jgi:indole-3-glycerol phosphate synthase
VLESVDPEILLLSADLVADGETPLERLLDLLPDVPAGKLAIAELSRPSRDDVAELERAGIDAVLVGAGDVGGLVDEPPPEV